MFLNALFLAIIFSFQVAAVAGSQNFSTMDNHITRECTLKTLDLDSNWFALDTSKSYGLINRACRSDNCTGIIRDVGVTSGSFSKRKANMQFEYKGMQKELDEVIRKLYGVLVTDYNLRLGKTRMMRFYKHVEIECGQESRLTVEIKIRRVFAL